ncbi:MAG: hypothetical protein RL648_885 [Verrucomicrobiota bacterium]|jgi:hypothetical protein
MISQFFKFSLILVALQLGPLSISADPIPPFMGDWRGSWVDTVENYHQRSPQLTAQVIGLGGDSYEVIFRGEYQRRATPIFQAVGYFRDGAIRIEERDFWCVITEDTIRGKGLYKSKEPVAFELVKFTPASRTVGRPAPDGAVVLFDGSDLEQWMHEKDGAQIPGTWQIKDGYLEVWPKKEHKAAGGDLKTRELFGSCEIHLEFWLPYEPDNRDQNRANSGIFINNVYEVQILDSYGLVGDWTECGALYKVSPPKVNRSLPPGQWQTFDIVYEAPQYDAAGNLVRNAVMTVHHNGELIHNQQELFEVTYNTQNIRLAPPPDGPGRIILQDHGHPIRFRNIWVRPME